MPAHPPAGMNDQAWADSLVPACRRQSAQRTTVGVD